VSGETTDDGETAGSRLASAIRSLARIGDYAVDIAGIAALAALGFSPASDATLQILAGAIASVALGKRYLSEPA
jgi:phosphate uptake regulator